MKYKEIIYPFYLLLLFSWNTALNQTNQANQKVLDFTNTKALLILSDSLASINSNEKEAATKKALLSGWAQRIKLSDGNIMELMRLDKSGNPVYYITENANAAISLGTTAVYSGGGLGLSLEGAGMFIGEWDGGAVRKTHEQLTGRVFQIDAATSLSDHSTHVCGTMIGDGTPQSTAKGMAPKASVNAYDWSLDASEMAAAAANGLLVSNHSYGVVAGWSGSSHWFGDPTINANESYYFGWYNSEASSWDNIAYNAPYYLIVKSAGNDRDDAAPPVGTTHSHSGVGSFTDTHPQDGNSSTGYDCLPTSANSKNILTVGAVEDVAGGYNGTASVAMSIFSGWGPTDDGRIKPDIVGNGVGLYSSIASADNTYSSYSGTSMSGPSVAGSCILLQEHYRNIHGNYMRASTLKGVIVHTADEAGTSEGPDYRFGWGLMNTGSAANLITFDGNIESHIQENTLNTGTTFTQTIVVSGSQPLIATLCWTDVPGSVEIAGHDISTLKLRNDLDLRISDGVTTFQPYVLSPSNPSAAATTGDNFRDNIEKVFILNPTAGNYTLTINHKGSLQGGSQVFSLILSGITTPEPCTLSLNAPGQTVSSFPGTTTFSITATSTWTLSETCPWLSVNPIAGNGNGTINITYQSNSGTASRSCDITVNCGSSSQTFILTQTTVPCGSATSLICNQPLTSTTEGLSNNISSYPCSSWNESGPEAIFRFTPSISGVHTFTLSNMSVDLDIFLLTDCSSGSCIQAGGSSISASLTAGTNYFISVDGNQDVSGSFTLTASCPCSNCLNAYTLYCSLPYSGSTVGQSSCLSSYTCSSWDESGPEMVYKFIPTASGSYTFTLSNMTTDLDIFLLTNCSAGSCISSGGSALTASLTANTTYYVVIDGSQSSAGSFLVTTSCNPAQCTTLNCTNASALQCDQVVNSTTVGGNSCASSYSIATSLNESGPEKVFTFTPTVSGSYSFALSNMTVDLDIFLLTSCSSNSSINSGNSSITSSLTAGITYYIVVDGNTGASGSFSLTVTCPCTTLNCTDATVLQCGVAANSTTVGQNSCVSSYPCASSWNESGPEKVFTFTPSTSGSYAFSLSGMTVDLDLFLLTSCSANSCISSGNSSITSSLTAGTTYYIVVDGNTGASSSFTLTVTCPCATLNCTGATALQCGAINSTTVGQNSCVSNYPCASSWNESGPEKIFTFTPASSGSYTFALSNMTVDLDIFRLSSCSAGSCAQSGGSSITSSLSAGTTYYIVVDGRSGASGSFTLTVTCPCSGLNCNSATTLQCGQVINSTTSGQSSCVSSYSCSSWNESGREKVYQFTPSSSRSYTFSLSNMFSNLDIFLLTSCSNGSCIRSGNSSVSASLTAGTIYYIVVDGRSGTSGSFRLTVTCPSAKTSDGDITESIPEDTAPHFKIYPNPTADNLNISAEGFENKAVISLYDIQGRKLFSNRVAFSKEQSPSFTMNLKMIPNGVYQVIIQGDDFRQVKKVVVAR